MWQANDCMTVNASHGLPCDKGVNNRFFRRLNGRAEERADSFVRYGLNRVRSGFLVSVWIRRRKSEEDIAGAIARG